MVRRVGRHVAGGSGRPAEDPLASALKEVFARWASGVCLVAVRDEGRVHALTVSAFMPLSLDPPLVVFSLGANAAVLPFLDPDRDVGVSILGAEQRGLASRYADSFPVGPSPFPDSGPPLAKDALAGLVCRFEELLERGDHHLVICRVLEAHGPQAGDALGYFDRSYHRFEQGSK